MSQRNSLFDLGNLLMLQERERVLHRVFRQHGIDNLEGMRAFEAGCANAYNLRALAQWGIHTVDLAGIDIDCDRIAAGRIQSPAVRFHCGSADAIPEADETFDLSLAFTLFSSVPDEDIAQGIGRELYRITRPGGLILIYDMRRRSPRNPNVHPISAEDIRRWFPHCPMRTSTLTLVPPVARALGRWAPWLYAPLAAVPLLRTHCFYALTRP